MDPEELSPFCCPGAGAAAPKVLSGLASWSPPVAGASSVAATPSFALRGLEPPLATAFSLPSAHSFVGRFFCAGMRCSALPHSHSLDLLVFRTKAVPEGPAGTGLGTPGRPAGACPGEAKAPLCQLATLGRPASVWRSLTWETSRCRLGHAWETSRCLPWGGKGPPLSARHTWETSKCLAQPILGLSFGLFKGAASHILHAHQPWWRFC